MSAVAAAVGQISFGEFQSYIEELATTEGRLVISGAILFLTLLIAVLIAPTIIRWTGTQFRSRFPEGRAVTAIDLISEYVPTTIGGFILRLIQVTLFGVALLALLVIWGLIDVAGSVLEFVGISIPVVTRTGLTGLIVLFAYIASDLLKNSIKELSNGANRVTDHQQEIVIRLGTLAVFAFAITASLTLWGLDLSGLLVGAGFLGIVVGMAARQTLGSMIAGFVLMFSRPFTIGDWVEIEGDQGIVTDITIMNTRMRNFDGESIVMPNDRVSNAAVTNRSEQGHLRIRVEVGIDYDTDPAFAEEIALEEIESVDSVTNSPPPAVVPTGFGDSAVVLEMRFWIDRPSPPRRWRATRAVIHNVKERFEKEGIGIPFPQRTLSDRSEGSSVRMPETETDIVAPGEPSTED
ncbi:mechanosensitive ion channel domain-containing protein [Halobacteriaceae archaeon SHR40]|uniref:mechanosensitive ion channel family protein n=1 Tax=Halovenus amylolytica TaxID=2500550 RepID=UPI000FE3CD9A